MLSLLDVLFLNLSYNNKEWKVKKGNRIQPSRRITKSNLLKGVVSPKIRKERDPTPILSTNQMCSCNRKRLTTQGAPKKMLSPKIKSKPMKSYHNSNQKTISLKLIKEAQFHKAAVEGKLN